jgi:DNA-binding NtrC family response regulator
MNTNPKANTAATVRVLVLSDHPVIALSLRRWLSEKNCDVEAAGNGPEALDRVKRDPAPGVILLDLQAPGKEDFQSLLRLRHASPKSKIIVLSSGDPHQLVQAVRMGAQDCLTRPLQRTEVDQVLAQVLNASPERPKGNGNPEEVGEGIEELSDQWSFVAASPVMQQVRTQVELLAKVEVPVLIAGEGGVGKETIARLVHKLSARSNRPLLKVNCAALPGDLLESDLFGYERGAFPGALRTKPGKFELGNHGTILLDEIGEMPSPLQAKLLHVLQEKQYCRMGGETAIDVDVRVLAATNLDAQPGGFNKRLRQDLYYRLSTFVIQVPPLRKRKEEIPLLLRHFMNRMAGQDGLKPLSLSPALVEACLGYSWPGNLRELEKFVKRYLVIADEALAISELQPELPDRPGASVSSEKSEASGNGLGAAHGDDNGHSRGLKSLVKDRRQETELNEICRALEEAHWNRKRAARLLDISYRGLLYKIRYYNIVPPLSNRPSNYSPNPG